MRLFQVGALMMLMFTASGAQTPGDRPAANARSTRSVVLGRTGMIATSQPLASAAGLRVLHEGGNAIDGAVTAAAVLAVVEPHMNGLGGDLFAIVYDAKAKKLTALNASGRSPRRATLAEYRRRALTDMPGLGILSATVPGVVDGWSELLAKHGTISLVRALAPAIEHARNGFAVTDIIAGEWAGAADTLRGDPAAAATFLPGGRPPAHGEIFTNPNLARILEQIAQDGRDAFYKGAIAKALVDDSRRRDGLFELGDFAEHRSDWVEPLSTNYRGYDLFEIGPNTQGLAALQMLNILEGFDLKSLEHNSAQYLHLLIEAKKLAFADRDAYLADADHVPLPLLKHLLSKEYAAERRKEIDPAQAAESYAPGRVPGAKPSKAARRADATRHGRGDTIYLAAADGQGNAISLIQSIYGYFGAGIVAGDTGFLWQNRGWMFTFQEDHPNVLAPHKRPLHTIAPAFVMKDGKPWLAYGVMGGDMQPQGHVQVLLNLVEFGMNIQEAGEAARVRHVENLVAVESAIDVKTRLSLASRGHRVTNAYGAWGGFQGVLIDPKTGVLQGGSDPRKDGVAIGY